MKPYIYCEPFCGMAAVFYFLLGCKPPISYMGSKAGYAPVIADILGLSRHHRPAAVVLGDVGPTVAVHAGLFGASGVTARDVAGMLCCAGTSFRLGNPDSGFNQTEAVGMPATETHGAVRPYMQRGPDLVNALPAPHAQAIAAIIRSWKDEEPRALWTRLKAESWPSLLPPKGKRWGQPIVGRWLGPVAVEQVARFLWTATRSYKVGQPESGFKPAMQPKTGTHHGGADYQPDSPAPALDAIPSTTPPLACYQGTASRLVEQLPERLDSWICYLDPPYLGTTGYPFGGCGREEVLRIALDLHRRGATVAISEAVRLDRELGDGWYAVQIDHARKGQKRTFSVQQSEWVTVNRAPVNVPGKQQGLFL